MPLSKIHFLSQNAYHDLTSCIKLIIFIGSSNTKHCYSELHLKKMKLVLLHIVIILGHIMLTLRFAFCDATISTTFLDFSRCCTFLYLFSHHGLHAESRRNKMGDSLS